MHQPVLLHETASYLVVNPHGVYIDATLGGGGHLRALLDRTNADARFIALDKDADILKQTREMFEDDDRVAFVHDDFRNLTAVMSRFGLVQADGILLDLGVSSFQLDTRERGFSYHEDAALDMRMNRTQSLTAADIVNEFSEADLMRILYEYGEEKYTRSIVRRIMRQRAVKPIHTTLELVDLIKAAVPHQYRQEKHPARKTFQALRIAVNDELQAVEQVLPQAVNGLKKGGRLCVITFHSLEDRIVKRFMQTEAKQCVCPPGLPICTCGHQARLQIATRKPIQPSQEECDKNPRSRSAKLRAATRI